MRKLMLFTIGFAAMTAVYAYAAFGDVLWLAAILLFILFIALLFIRNKACTMIAVMLLGASVGCFYCQGYDRILLAPVKALDNTTMEIEMTASDYSFKSNYGYVVDGHITLQDKRYAVRLYYRENQQVNPGDFLICTAQLQYTAQENNASYHKGDGIFLLAYGDEIRLTPMYSDALRYLPVRLRKSISDRIAALFSEDTAPFAKALLLGEDNELSFQDNISLQKSGIRHVVAVSGLHVSILFSILYFFTGKRKLLTLATGFPLLLLFAAVAGFSPSVMRACLMQALMILAVSVNKEYDPPTAVSFAALTILLLNPWSVTSVSFQLSFGSMIGIMIFSQRILDYFRNHFEVIKRKGLKARLLRWIAGSFSVSIGAMSVTLPLCAVYFGMVSVIGIFTNLITLWIISFIFCGIMLACLLSMIWMPLGVGVAYVISLPIHFVLCCARLMSAVPFGVAYTDSIYTVLWIVTGILLVILYLIVKKKKPWLLAGSLMVLYGMSLALTAMEPKLDSVRLTVVDVGQGQCILLQSKEESYLIDCGSSNGEDAAEKAMLALGAQGITRLDGIILTHYDTDHANGVSYLCDVFPVDRLYLPAENREMCRELIDGEEEVVWIRRNGELSCGVGKLEIYPAKNSSQDNESSLCILFQGENCAILITGDRDIEGERLLIEQTELPKLDALVVGHHGASTSTGEELLSYTRPQVAIISVGKKNYHGHPDAGVLRRLKDAGCVIYRTDRDGNIVIRW